MNLLTVWQVRSNGTLQKNTAALNIPWMLILLSLLVGMNVYAQSGKLFSVDRELSSSLINHVYQDRKGMIWVATEDGLNRYDGSKFTIYKEDKKKANSLLNNYVRLLFEDKKGHLFIGFFNGLQLYDHATDTFQEIPLILATGEKYNAHVITILERKNGDILVGTSGHGLFLLTFKGDQVQAQQLKNVVPSFLITYLFEDQEQNLWVSTEEKGLLRLSPDKKLKTFLEGNKISSICQDQTGNVFAGTMGQGLYQLDTNTDSFTKIPYPANPYLPIKTLFLNSRNQLYIGTDGNGLKIYDLQEKRILEANFNVTTFDFKKSKVHAIVEDKSGNIWLGFFQKGVMVLPFQTNKFNYIGYKSVVKNTIGSNNVMAVCQDYEGTLWIGTDNDGIYGIGPNGEQKAHFSHTKDPSSVPSTIMCIYEDSDHTLWIGSYMSGMAKLNRKTGICEYQNAILDNNGTAVQRIYTLVEDKDKNLWIGTMGSGLYRMNLQTRQIIHYDAVKGPDYRKDENMLHNSWINCLLLTRSGKLYIGTFDGISCFDLQTKSFINSFGTNRLLPGHIVYTLHEDHKGTIWLGTSRGLMYLDNKTRQIKSYTTENGLPSNVICAIQEDKAHRLWISTNYGISRFDPVKHHFTNYYANDGLQGNEFTKRASFLTREGQLMLGGINGLTYFNPLEITDQKKKLDVRITDFYIHDQPVKKGMQSGSHAIVDTLVMDAETFHLAYKDNSFSIEFSAMEFNTPERITYLYAMNEDPWISLRPGINRVSFSNLAPGSYHFQVKANEYSTYSPVKQILIIISPLWYFSVWAKIVYALILAGIGYVVIQQRRQRNQTRQKMQEHMHAKQINEAKLQFFINISHEIRTPMSLIISPLKKLMSSDKDLDRQRAYLTMHRNSERILLLINQLMDIQKIDRGQMQLKFQEIDAVAYIKDLGSIFDEQAHTKGIEMRVQAETEPFMLWLDPKNFDKVILNVLSNAFKFTPKGGKIDIYLRAGYDEKASPALREYAEIGISDSGIGMNESEMERIFERFYQIRNSQTNAHEGTGIGLHLTRSIVELHYGTIRAEKNPDAPGSRFIIRLPMGNQHLNFEEIDLRVPTGEPSEDHAPTVSIPPAEAEEIKIKSKSKRRVFVVDDNPEIRRYISQELAREYHITEFANGKEALSRVLEKTPDLIISDVIMPEMDGMTLCRKLKQNININHVPIILLTAKSEEKDTLEGIGMGADAYMLKPFTMDLLKKTVENIIRNREMLRNNYRGNQEQKDKVQPITMKSADEKLLNKIMDIINRDIGNPDLNVEMIATQVGISRVHLHRKLKELTNQSPRDLIRNIRLQQAANLLASKHLDISEVAFAMGFTNLAYFSSAFKEFYGTSPSGYMEAHLHPPEKAKHE